MRLMRQVDLWMAPVVPTVALSTLIKNTIYPFPAPQAFKRLAELGIVERLSRPSTKTASKVKEFWSVTARGCRFGKNMTSPIILA